MPSSAPHPAPPSFPTRRSSDLARQIWRRDNSLHLHQPRELFRRAFERQPVVPRLQRRDGVHLSGNLENQVVAPLHRLRGMRKTQRSEELTSELQSRGHLVCRLLLPTRHPPLSLHDALPISRARYGAGIIPSISTSLANSSGVHLNDSQWSPGSSAATAYIFPAILKTRSSPHCTVSVVCGRLRDRKSSRLNSSHVAISYAVFCSPPGTPLFPYTTLFRSRAPDMAPG